MEKDDKSESGHRPFLSLLSSVWQGHEKGSDRSGDKSMHDGNISRHSGSTQQSSKGKAIHTIGEGSFSLDDLDDSFHNIKPDSVKKAVTNDERTVQEQLPDLTFASEKRNADFHKVFAKSVDPNESLIEDCSCALTREILIQGRFYVTAHHVCFHSNILGRTTHLVVSFQEILEIKPKNTVGLFPNGIVIRTLHAQHTFASFVNRDHVLKLLRRLKDSTLNSRKVLGELGDSAAVTEASSLEDSDDSDQWNEESSFKRRRSYSSSFSFNSSGLGDSEDGYSSSVNAAPKGRSRSSTRTEKEKPRRKLLNTPAHKDNSGSSSGAENGDGDGENAGSGKWPVENLGPATHKPTSLPDLDSKEKLVDTFTIAAPLGVVANLIYGKDTSWFYEFQTVDLKNRDLDSIPPFKKKDGKEQRYFEYTKPLNGPVGPKQTKCKCTEVIEAWNMEDHVQVLISNKTPDVPSGDSFTTFTRCTMAWAEGNKTTIRHTTWLEWTGKSWLKKPIENGAMDGQQQYCKSLNTALQQKLRMKSAGGSKNKKTRQKTKKSPTTPSSEPSQSSGGGWSDPKQYTNYLIDAIGAIVVFMILRFIYNYFTGGQSQQHKILQQQIDLWQWLDSRLEDRNTFDEITGTLSNREIDEVIKLTELRLGRLRAIRGDRT